MRCEQGVKDAGVHRIAIKHDCTLPKLYPKHSSVEGQGQGEIGLRFVGCRIIRVAIRVEVSIRDKRGACCAQYLRTALVGRMRRIALIGLMEGDLFPS